MLSLFMLMTVISQCAPVPGAIDLTIEADRRLDSIPSGSGIVRHGDSAWIIGDDGTGIYQLHPENYGYRKLSLAGIPYGLYREERGRKHDFENATFVPHGGAQWLMAFGSGGRSGRDSLLFVHAGDPAEQRILSLASFYNQLRLKSGISTGNWNIEGAAANDQQLFLLNRGTNDLLILPLKTTLQHLFENGAAPRPEVQRLQLPLIAGKQARLSGACSYGKNLLLFSASVEDTPNWNQDGPVIGSIIGLYDWQQKKVRATQVLNGPDGSPLKEKIESVEIWEKKKGRALLLAIADNDDGSSHLFRLWIRER